jgi:ParB-like chromosome segregation protein Spo0J
MSSLRQSALLEESGDVRQLDDKLLDLMKRLGIEAFPPHETLVIPLERIVIPGADLVRPSHRLVRSIKRVGVLENPSVVLISGSGLRDETATFEVIFGRRRILAANLAGLHVVKCEAYESGTAQLSALLALMENEQRSSAWIREVQDLRRLIDEKVGMTLDDLVEFGFDRNSLTERLKIAQLPLPILAHIFAGKLNQAAARKLARLNATQLQKVADLALAGQEITEDLVKSTLRMQVNAGLMPLQAALEASMTPATTAENHLAEDGEGATENCPASGGAPTSLAAVLVTLKAFEQRLASSPATQTLRMLTKALIQELEVASRAAVPILRETQEEACHA